MGLNHYLNQNGQKNERRKLEEAIFSSQTQKWPWPRRNKNVIISSSNPSNCVTFEENCLCVLQSECPVGTDGHVDNLRTNFLQLRRNILMAACSHMMFLFEFDDFKMSWVVLIDSWDWRLSSVGGISTLPRLIGLCHRAFPCPQSPPGLFPFLSEPNKKDLLPGSVLNRVGFLCALDLFLHDLLVSWLNLWTIKTDASERLEQE